MTLEVWYHPVMAWEREFVSEANDLKDARHAARADALEHGRPLSRYTWTVKQEFNKLFPGGK